jgi:O-antigen/teichoic acid export membrane protein
MLFTLGVSLYTSRVVLNALGIEDYGTYSVVGGVVSLFSFFNAAMSSSTQRFLSFDIGKEDYVKLKQTFNATLNIHIGIGFFILLLAETIGLWFVNNKLNISANRMDAVNWVYQFSIFTFLVGVVQVPYHALIIARERMSIYAIFSIVEVTFKLVIVYLLVISPFDKLESYAFLIFIVMSLIALFYNFYCRLNFNESKYKFYYDKAVYQKLLSYSGWNLFGNIAAVARGQGINVILNLFFGTVLNAAYGITLQIQGAVSLFVTNFQMAVNPQIIKNYAQGNIKETREQILQSAKLSYFLLTLIVFPVLFNVDFILKIWLKNPPEYTNVFVSLCLINLLIDCISGPLMTGAQATGNIKWYQIVVGTLIFLNLPIAYMCLKIYQNPELIYYTSIIISLISLIFRLYFLKISINLSVMEFLTKVILRIILVSIISVIFFLLLEKIINFSDNWLAFFIKSISILTILIFTIAIFGINKTERIFINQIISKKLLKR